jgi:hypothetical protein
MPLYLVKEMPKELLVRLSSRRPSDRTEWSLNELDRAEKDATRIRQLFAEYDTIRS